jgi:pimeloyl-ACP methyl ester carboxylesterase
MAIASRDGIAFEQGGAEGPLLVLIHGFGATAGVWSTMLEAPRWPGRWLALDLPGHGASAPQSAYATGDYADALGRLIAGEAHGAPVTILGHSLGGAIALALASGRHGTLPERAFALGVKVDWTGEELARFAGLAERPVRVFAAEDEALAQFRKNAGLFAAPDGSPLLARGAVREGDGWRVAFDRNAFRVEAPDVAGMMAAARCPVVLACGEHDTMISAARLRSFDPDAREIAGAGHNAMVEAPDAIWDWISA